jgi:tetratricopeptide (TPR) repeat protein
MATLEGHRPSAVASTPPAAVAEPARVEPAVPRQLPPVLRQFAGRSRELVALTDLLGQSDEGGLVATISGTAGIGKTTLAGYWAHRVADRFPDGQLYVNLRGFGPSETPVAAEDALRGFLEALGVDPKRMPSTLDALVARYRSLLAGRRMLVLLDNARDPAQVRPLLPGRPGCLTLVTSRATMAGLVAAEGAHALTLSVLGSDAARELLARRLGTARLDAEPLAYDELVELCAGLPLALSVVAARVMTHPHLPVKALVAQLRSGRGRLDVLESGDSAVSVRTVFSWSYRGLSHPVARMFRLVCLAPGPDIGLHAAASLAGHDLDPTACLLDEAAAAYLMVELAPRRFTVHDLLREYGRERAEIDDTEPVRELAIRRLLDHYRHSAHAAALLVNTARVPLALPAPLDGVSVEPLADRAGALGWFEAERHLLRAAIGYAAEHGHDEAAWHLSWCLADFYHQRGYWHDWMQTQDLALACAQRLGDPAARARCHQYLGYAHIRINGHDQQQHLARALRLYRELGDDAGQASTHATMAISAEQQARYRDGLGHARKAVLLRRRLGQPGPLANALNLLGWFYALTGEHDRAIHYCEEALALHRRLGNANGEAATWDSLGYAHHHRGRHRDAVMCFEHAVDLNQRLGDRYQLALNLIHLADVHDAGQARPAAAAALERALAILTELDHPDAAPVRDKLHALAH